MDDQVRMYLLSAYWSLATLTTVGFGDYVAVRVLRGPFSRLNGPRRWAAMCLSLLAVCSHSIVCTLTC